MAAFRRAWSDKQIEDLYFAISSLPLNNNNMLLRLLLEFEVVVGVFLELLLRRNVDKMLRISSQLWDKMFRANSICKLLWLVLFVVLLFVLFLLALLLVLVLFLSLLLSFILVISLLLPSMFICCTVLSVYFVNILPPTFLLLNPFKSVYKKRNI